MTPEELAARYPRKPISTAPTTGEHIIAFTPCMDWHEIYYNIDGKTWHRSDCAYYEALSLSDYDSWTPIPEYDYEARIGELEKILSELATILGTETTPFEQLPGWALALSRVRDAFEESYNEVYDELARMKGEAT